MDYSVFNGVPGAFPKGKPRLTVKVEQQREEGKLQRAFIAAVWKRAKGLCEWCGVKCQKTIELNPKRGEVDHIRPRSLSKAKKFDPKNGRLLCLQCHTTRHRGTITKTRVG